MDPVSRIVLQVLQVQQGSLDEIVVRKVQVANFRGDDGLGPVRQRRITHGQTLVIRKVASLLLGAEGVATKVHREHQVGLLDDLSSIQLEIRRVKQQRILIWWSRGEVPLLVVGEAFGLLVYAQTL